LSLPLLSLSPAALDSIRRSAPCASILVHGERDPGLDITIEVGDLSHSLPSCAVFPLSIMSLYSGSSVRYNVSLLRSSLGLCLPWTDVYLLQISVPLSNPSYPTMPSWRSTIILIKRHRSRRRSRTHPTLPLRKMDPDCAICSAPATVQCDCEANGLDIAVRQAEQRMMAGVFSEIRYAPSSIPLMRSSF
jgi:hypothetical protein